MRIRNLIPEELTSCFRATIETESNFYSKIPSLVLQGYENELLPIKQIKTKSKNFNLNILTKDTIVIIMSYLSCNDLISLSFVLKNT
jgi:hypothetical protein